MSNTALSLDNFIQLYKEGYVIVDVRPTRHFAVYCIPHSISIELDVDFDKNAGHFIFPDQGIILVCETGKEPKSIDIIRDFGFTNIGGYLSGGIKTWVDSNKPVDVVISIEPEELELEIKYGKINLYDIRPHEAFITSRINHSENIEIDPLIDHIDLLDQKKLCTFYCEDGRLSMSLISYLKSNNRHNIYHVRGGFNNIRKNSGIELISGPLK